MFQCFTRLPDKECYLNLPGDLITDNPLDMQNIKENQDGAPTARKIVPRLLSATMSWYG
jgi:hypothetical protein